MDSFTQIALGAAVGEAVLGKKVGNRAMVWGAVGGTIPDLDIIANLVTDEMTALAFHRGISHSFLFAATFPIALGWLVHRLYSSGMYRHKAYKGAVIFGAMLFFTVVATVISAIPVLTGGDPYYPTIIGFVLVGTALAHWLKVSYYQEELTEVTASWKDWSWLLFWAVFTHPLLDCCTAYGTQIFQPFSDYRVAFNNISVVDPIYTLPLLIGLLLAARLMRHSPKRKLFNYLGLGVSTAYLAFTFWNKTRINHVFEESMARQEIVYDRYMTSPTIFNNVLWNCLAENEAAYYYGQYSLFDKKNEVDILTISKNHEKVAQYQNTETIKTLRWFSNDYYNVVTNDAGQLQLNDLRYGVLNDTLSSDRDYIFRFILTEENGKLIAHQNRETDDTIGETFGKLWRRVWGK